MEQKRVSYKVAKAIKEAGYPQYGHCEEFYNADGRVVDKMCDMRKLVYPCPTYLDVWLWLWRAKKFFIKIHVINKEFNFQILEYQEDGWKSYGIVSSQSYHDQEEAIIAAIDYLVENNLIK